jgi:RNA polymerase sigma-70 factor (ECF subfamily)
MQTSSAPDPRPCIRPRSPLTPVSATLPPAAQSSSDDVESLLKPESGMYPAYGAPPAANEDGPETGARPVSEPPPSGIRVTSEEVIDGSADDAALVRAAWRGDRRAHVAIWRKYTVLVRSKIGRSVGGQDVEDHVQEVFLRLFEYLGQLRDPAALRSFIIGITLRVAGTELRRRRCRWWLSLTPTGELPDPQPWGDDGSDTREVLGRLLAILGKLTPHSSRVFELRYIEEKELADVAKTMNISLATAKRHLARASARVFAMAEREPALAGFVHGSPPRSKGAEATA